MTLREARPADSDDLADIERLLEANDLPTGDIRSAPATYLLATRSDSREPLGVGGLEVHGTVGLVRSVAVAESARGTGIGTAIVRALESRAGNADLDALYLLTETATGFFQTHGFVVIDREDAPSAIRQTTQFAELCPASATVMRNYLE